MNRVGHSSGNMLLDSELHGPSEMYKRELRRIGLAPSHSRIEPKHELIKENPNYIKQVFPKGSSAEITG